MSGGGSVSYVSPGWNIEGVGDYDGSGRAGILWRNSSTEQGLHLADERGDADEQRKPWRP